MSRSGVSAAIARHALALPEAWEDHPWEGDRVAKVGKKIFAFLGGGDASRVSLELPHSSTFALSLSCGSPTPYGLGRHGWVTLRLDDGSLPDIELLREWVEESYGAVAPKRLIATLER